MGQLRSQYDGALAGKLDRVPDKIDKNLPQPVRISADLKREHLVDDDIENEAFLVRFVHEKRVNGFDKFPRVESGDFDIQTLCFQAAVIQDVIENPQERFPAFFD